MQNGNCWCPYTTQIKRIQRIKKLDPVNVFNSVINTKSSCVNHLRTSSIHLPTGSVVSLHAGTISVCIKPATEITIRYSNILRVYKPESKTTKQKPQTLFHAHQRYAALVHARNYWRHGFVIFHSTRNQAEERDFIYLNAMPPCFLRYR